MTRHAVVQLALLAALACPAVAQLPQPTPRNAVAVIATMYIYQQRCLAGGPLPEPYQRLLEAYLGASGLDMGSTRAGDQIKLEVVRQMLEVERAGGKYCPEDVPAH